MKKHLKHRGQAIAVFICSLVLIQSVFPAYAENEQALQNKSSDLQSELDGINKELLSISNEISSAEMQVEITNGAIMKTKDSLVEAEANEAKQYADMKARIKYMYEVGNATILEMLFSANNMSDFLNKADFIQNISDYDRDMLTALQKIQKDIADKKDLLEKQQDSLTSLQAGLQSRQSDLIQKANATSTDLTSYHAQLEKLRADKAAQLAAEAAAKAAAAAQAQNNSGGTNNSIINNGTTNVTAGDLDVFAAILDCEAKYEYNFMLAVATVIMNRVESSLFPNSIKEVIYADGQFDPVRTGKLDAVLAKGASPLAYTVAQDAINGARLAAVADCYFFLYAGTAGRPGVNIGDNLFFPSW